MPKKLISETAMLSIWATAIIWLAYTVNGNVYGIDDADIFFTYAENIASGNGIIYSKGIPPVEGYTSTLWMFLSSIMFLLGLDERGVLILSILIFIGTQLIIFDIIEKIVPEESSSYCKFLYIAIISASFGYISWITLTLMDVGIWGALVVSMTYYLLFNPTTMKRWIIAGVIFILAPLARPEAIIVAPFIISLILIKLGLNNLSKSPAIYLLIGVVVSTTLLTSFRLLYFGHPLPNTYYAKVSTSLLYNIKEGSKYFINFVTTNAVANLAVLCATVFGVAFVLTVLLTVFKKHELKGEIIKEDHIGQLSLVVMLLMTLPFATGGDHFYLFRFYQPAYPLLILIIVVFIARHATKNSSMFTFEFIRTNKLFSLISFFVMFAWLASISTRSSWIEVKLKGSPIAYEFQLSRNGRYLGSSLNEIFSKSKDGLPSVGVIAAGGIARTYNGPIYDLMGLNNSYIAHYPGNRIGFKNHAAFEKDAFFGLPVELLIASPDDHFAQLAFKGLFDDENFIRDWQYGYLYDNIDPTKNYEAFFRKKYIEKLKESSEYNFGETMKYNFANATWESAD